MMQTTRLFVYGTLQFPRIATAVTGRHLRGAPARLDGYARHAVRGAPYPGIRPCAGASVEGLLLEAVDAASRRRIDAFEGELYRRERVTVHRLDKDTELAAEAYVVRPGARCALAGHDWDPRAFAQRWHDRYLRELLGGRSAEVSG